MGSAGAGRFRWAERGLHFHREGTRLRRGALLAAAVAALAAPLSIRAEEILLETFDDEVTPGLLLPSRADGLCSGPTPPGTNAACIDDSLGKNGGEGSGRLFLTEAFDRQLGHAWVEEPIDLETYQVTVQLDLYIFGGSTPPADGLSVIFESAAGDPVAGRGEGDLGTGGLAVDYLSVAFDIWDNGENDPEGLCDGPSARTCHVEVNQNTDPGSEPSLFVEQGVPNFVAAGNAGDPIGVTITLNEREISVSLHSGHEGYGTREVLHRLLPRPVSSAPGGAVFIGVAAATSSANARQAIDNLRVTRAPIEPPIVEPEPPVEKGGINCGGGQVTAMLGGSEVLFAGDGAYDEVAEVVPGPPTVFVVRRHGYIGQHAPAWSTIDGPIAGHSDPSLEPVYATEATARSGLHYRQDVPAGRYRVTLLFLEGCTCGIDNRGRVTRRFDAEVQGATALRFFSPAEAAAMDAGVCGGLVKTAVERVFRTDVPESTGGHGVLAVDVKDLGGGSPPGDAQLSGLAFERLGDVTGGPLEGDIEDHRPPTDLVHGPSTEMLRLDFNAAAPGTLAAEALQGTATVNWGGPGPIAFQFQPVLMGKRLRIADDTRIAGATAILFDAGGSLVINPRSTRILAELDVFISNPDGSPPAEGLVLGIVEGTDPRRLGSAGGALGFADLGAAAVGVEIDLWEGGEDDDSGFNTDGHGHMAIVGSGDAPATVDHVQDQNDFDPALDGESGEWVDWLSPAGFHVEVQYSPGAHIEAFLTALDGSFPRRQVLGAFVTPFTAEEALVGIFAGTGIGTATMEIDNLRVERQAVMDLPETAVISGERLVTADIDEGQTVTLGFDGSASNAGDGETQPLLYAWSVSGPMAGADVARPCEEKTSIEFSARGTYQVTLGVDDQHAGRGEEATDAVTVDVRASGGVTFVRADTNCDSNIDVSDAINTLSSLFLGTGSICCRDAADFNDDGALNITDPVTCLGYLFLGGTSPRSPFPDCGSDPTEDGLDCAGFEPCR